MTTTEEAKWLRDEGTPGEWEVYSEPHETVEAAADEVSKLAHGSEFCGGLHMLSAPDPDDAASCIAPAVSGCGKTSEKNATLIAFAVNNLIPVCEERDMFGDVLSTVEAFCKRKGKQAVVTDDWQEGFEAALDAVAHRLKGNPIPKNAFYIGPRGSPYQLELERERDRLREAAEKALKALLNNAGDWGEAEEADKAALAALQEALK